jgi:hypothetical protein
MVGIMPMTRYAGCAALLLAVTACSHSTETPYSSAPPITQAPTTKIPADLDTAAKVAVRYVAAVRHHDAAAIYALAWSGLRKGVTRKAFVADMDLAGVTGARISGVVQVGWDDQGHRLAIAPVIVTSDKIPQIGRVLFLKEDGSWRFYDQRDPMQAPALTQERPKKE